MNLTLNIGQKLEFALGFDGLVLDFYAPVKIFTLDLDFYGLVFNFYVLVLISIDCSRFLHVDLAINASSSRFSKHLL